MRILEVLTYYRPHISGLTIYVERLSRALARQGHDVTVFTSHYDAALPRHTTEHGVRIVRIPVAFRVSKGVIMPTFGPAAWKMVAQTDIVHLHLPQFDAPGVALRGRLLGKPVVLTYHSDLRLPHGLFNRLVDRTVHLLNRAAGHLADAVVTYTLDFGTHSPFLSRFVGKKLHVIPPPVELVDAGLEELERFRLKHRVNSRKIIGIAARIAAEKGIEVLLKALPTVLEAHPDTHVLHANPDTIGERTYAERLAPLFKEFEANYHLLGPLEGAELTAFYRNLDCLVMCSLNNTETFGLVQIEAMMSGAPVLACSLPGVRQPVTMTGMGEITPVGDHQELAAAIIRVLDNPGHYQRSGATIAEAFSPEATAQEYFRLFNGLLEGTRINPVSEPVAYRKLREMKNGAYEPQS